MKKPRPRPKRLAAAEREKAVLLAATRAFGRTNYRRAGTAHIAREAGITEPVIYKHFASKHDLFLRILGGVAERILAGWTAALADADGTALDALRTIRRTYREGLAAHGDELKIQFQALAESDDPEILAQLRDNHARYVAFFADIVRRGRRDGSIRREVDPLAAAWVLNGMGFTLTLLRLLDVDRRLGERRIQEITDACLEWLAPSPRRASRRGREE